MKFYAISENYLYRNAFHNGERKSCRSMAVYVLKDRQASRLKKENPEKKLINRIGIQASKKVGGAVERNRAKRVIREAYRMIDRKYGIRTGRLIVIIPFAASAHMKMQQVEADLYHCMKKLNMLVNDSENDVMEKSDREITASAGEKDGSAEEMKAENQ